MNNDYMMQILKCFCQAWLRCSYSELTIKISIGKLSLSISVSELERFLINHDFQIRETKFIHYNKLQNLPFYHQAPFDRLIISQAQAEDYTK